MKTRQSKLRDLKSQAEGGTLMGKHGLRSTQLKGGGTKRKHGSGVKKKAQRHFTDPKAPG